MPQKTLKRTWQRRYNYIIAALCCCLLAIILNNINAFSYINQGLTSLRFKSAYKPLSGTSVLIDIDAKSLTRRPSWPWSYTTHASLISILNKAGASSIAFDLDRRSIRGTTAQFNQAVNASSVPVYLRPSDSIQHDVPLSQRSRAPSAQVNNMLTQFANNNFVAERNGQVRKLPQGFKTQAGFVPSLAYRVAGQLPPQNDLYIDYAFKVRDINRISYTDILDNEYPPDALKGKHVFIGVTFPGLANEHATSIYGVQSSSLLNIISYETIHAGSGLFALRSWVSWVIGIIFSLFILIGLKGYRFSRVILITSVSYMTLLSASYVFQYYLNTILPLSETLFVILCCLAFKVYREVEARSLVIFKHNMKIKSDTTLLNALISGDHDGILIVNSQGRIEACNEKASHFLEVDAQDAINVPLITLDQDLFSLANFTDNEISTSFKREYTKTINGEEITVNLTISQFKLYPEDSRFESRVKIRTKLLITLHDISQQKKIEAAERAAKESHAEISAFKSQLISTMSHELRTPLNSVIGFSDILKEEMMGPIDIPEYKEYAELINLCGRKLLFVINDLMLATRIQSEELVHDFSHISINTIFELSIKEAKKRGNYKNHHIDMDLPDPELIAMFDRDNLSYALSHLIDNAFKFSLEGSPIYLSARMNEGLVHITIKDQGIGCEPSKLSTLTDMFAQGDGTFNREFEGCGMGLFLVDTIIQHHGGFMTFTSHLGKEFTVKLYLPLLQSRAPDNPTQQPVHA